MLTVSNKRNFAFYPISLCSFHSLPEFSFEWNKSWVGEIYIYGMSYSIYMKLNSQLNAIQKRDESQKEFLLRITKIKIVGSTKHINHGNAIVLSVVCNGCEWHQNINFEFIFHCFAYRVVLILMFLQLIYENFVIKIFIELESMAKFGWIHFPCNHFQLSRYSGHLVTAVWAKYWKLFIFVLISELKSIIEKIRFQLELLNIISRFDVQGNRLCIARVWTA